MSSTANTFSKLRALLKESYGKKGPKAQSMEEASKDPMKFMEKNKNPSWKKLKGVAFK